MSPKSKLDVFACFARDVKHELFNYRLQVCKNNARILVQLLELMDLRLVGWELSLTALLDASKVGGAKNMPESLTNRFPWMQSFEFIDSIAMQRNLQLGLGAVLYQSTQPGSVLAVRKAPKPGYRFSSKWAMPGGMIRSSEQLATVSDEVFNSLQNTVNRETSWQSNADFWQIPDWYYPLATSYEVRGKECRTLMLVVQSAQSPETIHEFSSQTASIDTVGCLSIVEYINEFAPINQVFLGRIALELGIALPDAWHDNCKAECARSDSLVADLIPNCDSYGHLFGRIR